MVRAQRQGAGPAPEDSDVEALIEFAERLLPLPPFEVWLEDFARHRPAHLDTEPIEERGPRAEGPVTLSLRRLEFEGEPWHAALEVAPGPDVWTGRVRFHSEADAGARAYSTAGVFRGPDAESVRRRFEGFDDHTLAAFLRSVLP